MSDITGNELSTLLVAIFGALGAILVGFYAFTNKQMRDARSERTNERKDFTTVLAKLSKSMDNVATSNKAIAAEMKRGNEQSEERNGHLGELIIQSTENMKTISNHSTMQVLDAVGNVKTQNVEHQHIVHKTVENEVVKNKTNETSDK